MADITSNQQCDFRSDHEALVAVDKVLETVLENINMASKDLHTALEEAIAGKMLQGEYFDAFLETIMEADIDFEVLLVELILMRACLSSAYNATIDLISLRDELKIHLI